MTAERHAGGTVTTERAAPASPGNGSPASGAPSAPPRTPDPDFVRPGARVAAVTAGVEDPRPVLAALLPEAKVGHADIDELSANPPAVAEPYAVALVARTPTDLRRLVSVGEMLPAADRIMVAILETPSWLDTPQVTLARGMGQRRLREMRVVRLGATGWLITTRFNRELGAGEVAAGVARGMTGHHLNAYPLPAFGLGDAALADWRAGDPDTTCGSAPERSGVPSCDLGLRLPGAPWDDDRVPTVERPPWRRGLWTEIGAPGGYGTFDETVLALCHVPPVDERSVNPRGILRVPTQGMGEVVARDGRWTVRLDGADVLRFPDSGLVTDADVDRLRTLRGLRLTWSPGHTGPITAARVVAGLAAAGIPLVAERPAPAWALATLGEELTSLIPEDPADLDDELRREEVSVRLRRHALRTHGTTARWTALAREMGLAVPPEPTVSVVLCTRRTGLLGFALRQIARQRGVRLEVVLALHGIAAGDPAVSAALTDVDLPITVIEIDADVPFGAALNTAVARCSGTYVTKWDDDDWYGPDHLSDLLLARLYTGADLVGAASEFFYLEQINVTIRRRWPSETMADHVAGGTFLMSRETFAALGGFRPIPRAVDVELFQKLLRAGGCLYRTHGLGFVARRSARGKHTWQEPVGYFLHRAKDQWRGFRPSRLLEHEPEHEQPVE